MSLSALFNGVINSFKSDDITDNLIDTRNRIRDGSLVVVAQCISDTKNTDFSKNVEYRSALSTVQRHYPKKTDKLNLFQAYGLILTQCDHHLDEMVSLVEKYFTKTVDKNSITYPRAQIMAMAEMIDFIGEFIPKYCRYIVVRQGELAGGKKVDQVLSKAQLKYIKENTLEFYKSLTILSKAGENIKQLLKEIPEIVVSEDGAESKMIDARKLDPSGVMSRFLSAGTNPFYYWRMWRVDARHEAYKRAKEEAESIKIELEAMNAQITHGQVDAYVDRQRTLAKERLDKLEYQISKHEESVRNTRY